MRNYEHIFFDLDHTLWDFDKNCAETLEELYINHNMAKLCKFSLEDLIREYKFVNELMWTEYNAGKITKQEIREMRFINTFKHLGVEEKYIPASLNIEFMNICPSKGNLLPYAHEVLSYLKSKYILHIITNGFKETQHIKISSSNLNSYFKEVINSDLVGFQKPDRRIFQYAINKAGANSCETCIMIGDDLDADIIGARNAGLDHIFLNRKNQIHREQVTHEITCLSQLLNIL